MTIDTVFIGLIFSLVLVLILIIVKTFYTISLSLKIAEQRYINLQQQINAAQQKREKLQGNIKLINRFNESLINRLFVIIKDILSVQKLIFGKHGK